MTLSMIVRIVIRCGDRNKLSFGGDASAPDGEASFIAPIEKVSDARFSVMRQVPILDPAGQDFPSDCVGDTNAIASRATDPHSRSDAGSKLNHSFIGVTFPSQRSIGQR